MLLGGEQTIRQGRREEGGQGSREIAEVDVTGARGRDPHGSHQRAEKWSDSECFARRCCRTHTGSITLGPRSPLAWGPPPTGARLSTKPRAWHPGEAPLLLAQHGRTHLDERGSRHPCPSLRAFDTTLSETKAACVLLFRKERELEPRPMSLLRTSHPTEHTHSNSPGCTLGIPG